MLNIIRAGIYTSVQDSGRHGFRQSGLSHCGALDKPAFQTANLRRERCECPGAGNHPRPTGYRI